VLYGSCIPISGQTDFRDSLPYKEKTTLPRALADVSELVCVTALDAETSLSVSRFRNINLIPFRGTAWDSFIRHNRRNQVNQPVSMAFATPLRTD
jgi:hypothetical protein